MERDFLKELEKLINKYSKENGSNTPDYILAAYLQSCLYNFDTAVNLRNGFYSELCEKGTNDDKVQEIVCFGQDRFDI